MSTQKARSLRKNMTDAERVLWQHLRNRRFQGYKFRRQHSIGPYIVDFICPDKKLVIEIDGGQHADRIEYDKSRTLYIEAKEYRVKRFWNNEVLQETESVLESILNEVVTPHPGPLP